MLVLVHGCFFRRNSPPPSVISGQDLVFYPTLAHATEQTQPLHNKYTTVPRFLLAMECLLFIMRPAQILLWCKLWELDFGEMGGSDAYTNIGIAPGMGAAVPVASSVGQHSQFAGGGTHHVTGGGAEPGEPRNGYRPFIVPEGPSSRQQQQQQPGDAYVPPFSPPLGSTQQSEYGE